MIGVATRAAPLSIAWAPPLGVVLYDDSLEADALISRCARRLVAAGYRLGGVVQANIERLGRRKCDMRLTDLMAGDEMEISSDCGEGARGCRLDIEALTQAGVSIERAVAAAVDLIVINKFGKQEAYGRGLRPVIAEALISGIPVLIGVSRLNLSACEAFVGGPLATIAPTEVAITRWCRSAIRRQPAATLRGPVSIGP
jgi:nucleoside-triphosphatase THEP1